MAPWVRRPFHVVGAAHGGRRVEVSLDCPAQHEFARLLRDLPEIDEGAVEGLLSGFFCELSPNHRHELLTRLYLALGDRPVAHVLHGSLAERRICGRTVADGSEFCLHHTRLLATVDAETMRQGRTPKKRSRSKHVLHVISDAPADTQATTGAALTVADPATVRHFLAAAAAENVEQLKTSLLEAAGSAVRPLWLTVECTACGERSRVEAPVPEVRARVAAIELLLREGLGRAPSGRGDACGRVAVVGRAASVIT